jgi:hypothetical protein
MEKYPDREILSQYKGQQSVENISKFIKYPALVGAYCLKNPERYGMWVVLIQIA